MPNPGYISIALSLVVLLAGLLVALGAWRERTPNRREISRQANQASQALAAAKDELRREITARLYLPDGTSIYIPRQDCREARGEYSGTLCRKLDEIRAEGQRRHEEYMQSQQEHLRRHEDITEFMGAVRRFMREIDRRPPAS